MEKSCGTCGYPNYPAPNETVIRIFLDARTYGILSEVSRRTGRSIENIAEAAVADEAIRSIPPQAR